ncbi:MAG: class I SAM-dependent methyltransferase [Gammaproteobacteria bacterium]|nr:class I SAM-dependent methyltransferase [Gammaproteobacteria bacterium]
MSQRKQHWDNIYTQKSSTEVSWYQKEPLISLDLIEKCHFHVDDYLIDVGGGASHLVDYLLRAGYQHLMVLDISAKSLEIAQQRLGDEAAKVLWLESDITEFSPSLTIDLWHDRAVFHFLVEPSDRRRYIDALDKTLKSGGHVIIAAFALGGPTQCSGLDIVQYDAKKLMIEFGDGFRILDQQSEMHMTPANKPQQFTYYRLQKL